MEAIIYIERKHVKKFVKIKQFIFKFIYPLIYPSISLLGAVIGIRFALSHLNHI